MSSAQFDAILDALEETKQNMSDAQYKDAMEALMSLHRIRQPLVTGVVEHHPDLRPIIDMGPFVTIHAMYNYEDGMEDLVSADPRPLIQMLCSDALVQRQIFRTLGLGSTATAAGVTGARLQRYLKSLHPAEFAMVAELVHNCGQRTLAFHNSRAYRNWKTWKACASAGRVPPAFLDGG